MCISVLGVKSIDDLRAHTNLNSKGNMTNTLKVACWNSRGLNAAIPCLRDILHHNDVVALSEHWLHNNRLGILNEIDDNFECMGRASRASSEDKFGTHRGQGGVAILWRKDLKGTSRIETIKHDRICGLRIQTHNNISIAILSVYMPANGSRDNLSVSLDELEGVIGSLGDSVIPIVCGDFNGNMGTLGGKKGTGTPTKAGKYVKRFMDNQNMIAVNMLNIATGSINTFECHNGKSIIDYFMIPSYLESEVCRCHTGSYSDLNTSDHLPIEVTLNISMLPRMVTVDRCEPRLRWDRLDNEMLVNSYQNPLNEKLRLLDAKMTNTVNDNDNIDGYFSDLVDAIHNAAMNVPRSKFRSNLKPYWSAELDALKKEKMFWFKKWKTEGRSMDDWDPTRFNMKRSKKVFVKTLRRLSKQYEEEKIAEAAKSAEIDR